MSHSIGMISSEAGDDRDGHPDPDIGGGVRAPIDEPDHDGVTTLDSGATRAGDGTPDSAARPG